MAEVSTALAAAWTRWQRYHQLHRGRVELGVAEAEAQFELVATGLVLDDKQVQELFQDDAEQFIALLTPLPNVKGDGDVRRFHFVLVAAGVLLDQYLQSIEALEGVTRLLTGPLTDQVLLPVLQLERYVSLHHAALRMIQSMLQLAVKSERGQEPVTELFGRVKALMIKKQEVREEENNAVSYGPLCSLLELLLCQKTNELVETSMEIYEHAIKNWKQHPQFLRAVVLHVVPRLLDERESDAIYQRLADMVVEVWESLQTTSSDSTFPHELLYLVCIIIPKTPRKLIADVGMQKLVCFALRHNDSLLRKQGLHILKVAFSHCTMLSVPQETTNKGKSGTQQDVTWVNMWQNFLTASEVIQMHHEQHLIEQVWPQVAGLLSSHLIVHVGTKQHQDFAQWPVLLTFDWMQSLLARLFAHDNPVVKRLFISNFMETCIQVWQSWERQRSTSNGG